MEMVDQMGMSYAMAYPFGICGILFTMWMLRVIFRVNVETEAQQHESSRTNGGALIKTINIRVENPNLHDLAIKDVPILNGDKIICSRLKREETLKVPSPDTIIQLGDLLHLVGQPADLHNAQLVIGQEVDTSLSTKGTDLRVERVVVTNENVLGKRIRDLHFKERYDVVISRLNRAGVELVASGDISLQFGDILNLVGRPSAIDAVANVLGNAQQKLQQVQMLPVFIGIGLGVLLGSIPVFVPWIPGRVETGAGGRTADYGVDPRAYRQYRQAVLVYAAKRQPRAAGAGDRAVPLGRWSEIWWGFCEYHGQWRRAKLDWLWCPDHRRSADYCWHSGADVSQNELPDHVRDAGRFHDRSSGAGVC